MALRDLRRRLTEPVEKRHSDQLRERCAEQAGCTPMAEVAPRALVAVVGEVGRLRVVPRAGAPSIEATLSDGTGSVVAVWTGRRELAGLVPGRRVVISGRGSPTGPAQRLLYLNPAYELLEPGG